MRERSSYKPCIIYLIIAILNLSYGIAAAAETIPLWEGKIPGALGDEEKDMPVLLSYIPTPDKATGAAVVICPGGGYGHLAMDHEGDQIGQWFESIGVAAFVLRYRLPANGYQHPIPLFDAQRAIRTVRFHADKWNVQPDKIGVLGFSAGGHLASSAGTHFNKPAVLDGYQADKIDAITCRPDFMVLIYPVISMQSGMTHEGSRNNLLGKNPPAELVDLMSNEMQVTEQTPPTFLIHASDDTAVLPENSVRFYQALLKASVPVEMHLFLKGGHGFGTRESAGRVSQWPALCEGWMRQMKFLSFREISTVSTTAKATEKAQWKFDFGTENTAKGYTPVTAEFFYTPENGYGFLQVPLELEPYESKLIVIGSKSHRICNHWNEALRGKQRI